MVPFCFGVSLHVARHRSLCTEGPKLEFGGPMSQADSGWEVEGE